MSAHETDRATANTDKRRDVPPRTGEARGAADPAAAADAATSPKEPSKAGARPVRFSLDDANRAYDAWGANCGPAAIAAVLGLTLDEVRPHLGDFERKRYTNPTLMYATLRRLDVAWQWLGRGRLAPEERHWPKHGLVRIQWEGPWTEPGVPMRARYRATHWIGAQLDTFTMTPAIFDINAMCVGGWIPLAEWRDQLVPWLLPQVQPKASGKWHQTHVLEILPQ